jgi:hypothetical protein
MPNYLQFVNRKIDAELSQLYARIKELEAARTALAVLNYSDEASGPPIRKTLKTRKEGITSQMPKVRALVMQYLYDHLYPNRAKSILEWVMPQVSCSESTVWKAMKDLRDEGQINWDRVTRMYEVNANLGHPDVVMKS